MKKKLRTFLMVASRQSFVYALVACLVGAVLWYGLGTLVPGFSDPELAARSSARSLRVIVENPLFLPHKLMQYVLIRLGQTGAFWMRLPSTFIAIGILVVFYRIVRTWYSKRIAMFASTLFLCSAWFLHYARLATPEIMYAGTIALLWAGIRLKSNRPRLNTVLLGTAIVGCALYTPGLVWLLVLMLIWRQRTIRIEVAQLPKAMWPLLTLGVAAGAAPLVYALVQNPQLVRVWLALPAVLDLPTFVSNAWHIPLWLTLHGPVDVVHWLGRVPLLDSFSVIMFGLGAFMYSRFLSLDRVRTIIGILVVGAVLTMVNGPMLLIMIAPIVFMVVASGIALLLQQWFTVFPRNPLARGVGLTMMTVIVLLACSYHLSHYFIAWPRASETRQAFQIRG